MISIFQQSRCRFEHFICCLESSCLFTQISGFRWHLSSHCCCCCCSQLPPSVARLAAHTFVCRFCEDAHRVESVLGMCALPVPLGASPADALVDESGARGSEWRAIVSTQQQVAEYLPVTTDFIPTHTQLFLFGLSVCDFFILAEKNIVSIT